MGTSKSYGGVKGNPKWSALSSSVSRACNYSSGIPNEMFGSICSSFVSFIGGSATAGNGGSKIAGKSGIRASKNLAGILVSIYSNGLSTIFPQIGVGAQATQNIDNVVDHLIEYCVGTAITQDDVAAKSAERHLLEDICLPAKSLEDLDAHFHDVVDQYGVDGILVRYDAYYLYEHFSIDFYEKLVRSKGLSRCIGLFKHLKLFLIERVRNISLQLDLKRINWDSPKGESIAMQIFTETLKVFEGYEG